MSFQNLLSSCIPFKPHQLRNIVFMKDYRIACGISFCQTADFFTAFQKSVQKTIHCIRPQMGLVSHKKAVKMFLCLFRAARFPALSDPQLQGGGNAQSTLSILHRAKTVFCGCFQDQPILAHHTDRDYVSSALIQHSENLHGILIHRPAVQFIEQFILPETSGKACGQ